VLALSFDSQTVELATVNAIKTYLTSVAIAPFVGSWTVHAGGVTINADGTGSEIQGYGFACDSGNTMCGRNATLTFMPAYDAAGGIIGTYTSVSYTDPTYQPTSDDPQVGDSFELTLALHDRLIRTWLGRLSALGSGPLCGPDTPDQFWDCGA
jgi:hypothetical protein